MLSEYVRRTETLSPLIPSGRSTGLVLYVWSSPFTLGLTLSKSGKTGVSLFFTTTTHGSSPYLSKIVVPVLFSPQLLHRRTLLSTILLSTTLLLVQIFNLIFFLVVDENGRNRPQRTRTVLKK